MAAHEVDVELVGGHGLGRAQLGRRHRHLRQHERAPVVLAAAAAAHAEAVLRRAAVLRRGHGELLRRVEEGLAGGRRLQPGLLEQVGPVVEVDHHVLQRQVVLLAVVALVDVEQVVAQVVAAGPGGHARVDRLERAHLHQLRLLLQLDHRHVRRLAAGHRGEQAVVVVVPGDVLSLDLDARVLRLEVGHQAVHHLGLLRVVEVVPEHDVLRCLGVQARNRGGGQAGGNERAAQGGEAGAGHVDVSSWVGGAKKRARRNAAASSKAMSASGRTPAICMKPWCRPA